MVLITKEFHKYDISILLLLQSLNQKSYGQLIILASYSVFRLLAVADGKHGASWHRYLLSISREIFLCTKKILEGVSFRKEIKIKKNI